MPLVVNWNRKSAIKYEKKQSAKEKSVKNKQISIKIGPKTSNPQVFKKNRNSTKKTRPNSRENSKVGNNEMVNCPQGKSMSQCFATMGCHTIMLYPLRAYCPIRNAGKQLQYIHVFCDFWAD